MLRCPLFHSTSALSWKEEAVAVRRSLPLATKHQQYGDCEYHPLCHLVYTRIMKATKMMRVLCVCTLHWLRGLLFTELLLLGRSLELWWGMKTTVESGHKLTHKCYNFCAGLSGSASDYLTGLPGYRWHTNVIFQWRVCSTCICHGMHIYLTCSMLHNKKYASTGNKILKTKSSRAVCHKPQGFWGPSYSREIYASVSCYLISYTVAETTLICYKSSSASLWEELHFASSER